jgi:putative salt-induced outer membrane protein YdiY
MRRSGVHPLSFLPHNPCGAMLRLSLRILVAPLIFLPGLLLADQVTLKNGDKISGQIIKKDGDKLTVKSEFLGEVTIPWAAVTSITSDQDLAVVLPGDKTITGRVNTTDGKVRITAPGGEQTVAVAEVSAIRNPDEEKKFERMLRPGLLALWAGYFDLGLALARGNARATTLSTAFNASRVTRNDKTTLYFNELYSTATIAGKSAATADALRGGLSYDRKLHSRLFVNVFNDYEKDRFQNLDLRFVLGGGLGFSVIKSERTRLDILGGIDYNRSHFEALPIQSSAEAYFGDDWTYKLSGITALNQSFRIFPDITRSGEYRMNFDLGAATTLRKWLSWQLTASDRYLSDPVFGRRRNDVLLTTGFRVSFAR